LECCQPRPLSIAPTAAASRCTNRRARTRMAAGMRQGRESHTGQLDQPRTGAHSARLSRRATPPQTAQSCRYSSAALRRLAIRSFSYIPCFQFAVLQRCSSFGMRGPHASPAVQPEPRESAASTPRTEAYEARLAVKSWLHAPPSDCTVNWISLPDSFPLYSSLTGLPCHSEFT
jgi:hypothetical protein